MDSRLLVLADRNLRDRSTNVVASANAAHVGTRPAALETSPIELWLTGVIREGSQEITPVADCDEIYVGDRLLGSYLATDRGCCRVRLHLQATLLPRSESTGLPQPSQRQAPAPSGTWELHTAHMRPSGYTLTLQRVRQTVDGSTQCCGSVALDFQLAPRPLRRVAAPSPRPSPRELTWKLTNRAACR